MDIFSIVVQPPAGELMAAHRPIQFSVSADAVVPSGQPMYCDVYFSSSVPKFYKTLTGYSYIDIGGHSIYNFDIQDTAQEFLTVFLPFIMTGATQAAASGGVSGKHLIDCFCRFRGSSYVAGILVPNATVPIQGTDTSAPVAGTGTDSHVFKVMKATLRPMDAPKLLDHMAKYRLPISYNAGTSTYTYGAVYPLSNIPYNPTKVSINNFPSTNTIPAPTDRPEKAIDVYYGDHGFMPVYLPATLGTAIRIWVLFYTSADAPVDGAQNATTPSYVTLTEGIWYLPYGQVDLIAIGGGAPNLGPFLRDHIQFPYYRVQLTEPVVGAGQIEYFISPMFRNLKKGYQNTRLWFQNNFGVFEQVSFIRQEEQFKTSSSSRFTPLSTVGLTSSARLDANTGNKRFNVTSNDEIEVTAVFAEVMMPWLKELLATSMAYMEVEDPELALSTTPQGLMPVMITDAGFETIKTEERYEYLVKVKFTKSIDYINIRN